MQIQSGSVIRNNILPSATTISDSISPLNDVPALSPVTDVGALESVTEYREPSQQDQQTVEADDASAEQVTTELQLNARLDAKLEYDKNTQATQSAISTYLLHEHAAQRDSISQMVGIDTYA
ncbi:hypothetical protein [Shewanella psychrotolerans]|uniref:hypothetical protein n=1 Tax=Shewanella psychrotolerans TaxID=2864206 RepID=UPI001C65A877|nr:hypothetical protein [Shewanella psychrotolerans]QYK00046.1 hypothetical protein K0I62_11400 [Shewanella psychrotolerans]